MKTTQHARTPLLVLLAFTGIASAQLKVGSNPETIAGTSNFEAESSNGTKTVIDKTTGNLGIGTTTPATALTVNGGIATNFSSVTANAYTLAATDSTVAWNGTAEGTITLPAAVSGSGNFKGRSYTVKNISGAYNVTIAAAGAELIGTNSSLTLAPQASVVLISSGATTGSTWQSLSQAGTFTISGASASGYDLSGLSATTANISNTRWNASDLGSSETTDATCDFPSTEVAAAMNSLPNGGIIKMVLPAVSGSVNPAYFDIALPDASAYVGKTFYLYADWVQSGLQSASNNWGVNLLNVIPTASDAVTSGTPSYKSRGSAGTVNNLNIRLGDQAYSSSPTQRAVSTPVFKIVATGPNNWFFENGGAITFYDLIAN